MIHADDFKLVLKECVKAEAKHPNFPEDVVKMISLVAEEAGEAIREANHLDEGKGDIEDLKHELYQTIQVSFRALSEIRRQNDKGQQQYTIPPGATRSPEDN